MEPGDIEAPQMRDEAEKLDFHRFACSHRSPLRRPKRPRVLQTRMLHSCCSNARRHGVYQIATGQAYAGTFAQRQKIDQEQKINAIQQRIVL